MEDKIIRIVNSGLIVAKYISGQLQLMHVSGNGGLGILYRNTKCYCCSGKKYKNCCLKLDMAALEATLNTPKSN